MYVIQLTGLELLFLQKQADFNCEGMILGTDTVTWMGIKQLKINSMKIFLSYGHDANAPLIEKIKEYLSKDAEGNLRHEIWIDTSKVKTGKSIYPMSVELHTELHSNMKIL